MLRYWALGKFGEHSRGVRVARGAAECNSSLLSALQTSQVLNISTYAQLQHELIVLEHYQRGTSFWKKRNCLCCSSMCHLSFVWEIHFNTRQRFISYISIKSRLRSVKNWRVTSCIKMDFYFDEMQNSHMWKKNKPAIWLAYLQQATTSVNDSWLTNSSKKA